MREYLVAIIEFGSSYIGFVPDFGCFATAPNKLYWDSALKAGASLELLELAKQLRYDDVPLEEAQKKMLEAGADDLVMSVFQGMYGFVQFRRDCQEELDGLREIMPYCVHMHGKFHYLYENNREASIPYERILPVLIESGYDGYIVSEYEGHETGDAVEMTRRHLMMEKELIGV